MNGGDTVLSDDILADGSQVTITATREGSIVTRMTRPDGFATIHERLPSGAVISGTTRKTSTQVLTEILETLPDGSTMRGWKYSNAPV